MKRKPYTTPIWWLGIILFIKLATATMLIFMYLRLSTGSDGAMDQAYTQLIRKQLIGLSVYTLVLVGEAIVYWKIRYSNSRKGLVWGHLASWIITSFIMPAFYFVLVYWLSTSNAPGNYRDRISSYGALQQGIMWGVLIIGHLCFAMVLIDAWRKKKHPEEDVTDDAESFLDDYQP